MQIKLSNSEIYAVVDADLPEAILNMKWRVMRRSYKGKEWVYAIGQLPGRKTVLLHRLIAGSQKGQHVDHINGNTLDNRKANLRICSHAENMRNRERSRFGASGYKGVHKHDGNWRAQIEVDGVVHHLGVFSTPEEGARAYASAAEKHHGRYAHL